jgi:hypothetical protein
MREIELIGTCRIKDELFQSYANNIFRNSTEMKNTFQCKVEKGL